MLKCNNMNIAFFFNSNHKTLGDFYGHTIMEWILKTNILQSEKRNMRVCIGDILTAFRCLNGEAVEIKKLCSLVYEPNIFDKLITDRLVKTHGNSTVFCWMFQNMTKEIAERIHEKLCDNEAYLGSMDVNFSNMAHYQYFKKCLPEDFRFHKNKISIFYYLGESEDIKDIAVEEIINNNNFEFEYEDSGGRGTILDNYDTLEHFKRIDDFVDFSQKNMESLSRDDISDIVHAVEELHPKLFDGLASISRTLLRAETEEDLAQVSLSCRRLLKNVADSIFPAEKSLYKNMSVKKDKIKNRLFAYVDKSMTLNNIEDESVLENYRININNVYDFFSEGVHSSKQTEEIRDKIIKLLLLLRDIFNINPKDIRNPYIPYELDIKDFVNDIDEKSNHESHLIF